MLELITHSLKTLLLSILIKCVIVLFLTLQYFSSIGIKGNTSSSTNLNHKRKFNLRV